MDNVWQLIGVGAVAGVFPIYLGIGLALLIAKGINRSLEGYLTGIATGVLVYLFFDLMHEAVEQTGIFKGDIIQRYQLQVEDAEMISRYEQVIFIDAFQNDLPDGLDLGPIVAKDRQCSRARRLGDPRVDVLIADRLVRDPARLRVACSQRGSLGSHAWRRERAAARFR